ncbi:MAG: hypothetical protein HC890_05285 [Chloroflexaceae bacterium]|nr:hypothetical protein [Chloroflexaceae bacterium]
MKACSIGNDLCLGETYARNQKTIGDGGKRIFGVESRRIAQPQWQVYGTYFSQAVEIAGATLIKNALFPHFIG